ncbi:unnamed protein product [Penicillium salamii]|nr:unnamed protein product [Penicillium salamii]CAG8027381.1 unnamed protein product [Penicillium salamii]CAG8410782.1 unnamed protein product [Penicillium salamii]
MTIGAGKLPASWVGPCAGRTFWAECGVRWDSSATGHFDLDNFDCSSPPKLRARIRHGELSALFNFRSLLLVLLLIICTSSYAHSIMPGIMDRNQNGMFGIFWKCARIGERLSPYVSICCVLMAVSSVPKRHTVARAKLYTDNCVPIYRSLSSLVADH